MAARKTRRAPAPEEDGHDAIVRRLLEATVRPATPPPGTVARKPRSPAALLAFARAFSAQVVPALVGFTGGGVSWRVGEVRPMPWRETEGDALASPLTRDGRLAALLSCEADFLSVLMGALFGSCARSRSDPTASELSVFAQLAVRLRDGIDPSLDHAPPEAPAEAMRLFAPDDPEAISVRIEAKWGAQTSALRLSMTEPVARRFGPPEPSGAHGNAGRTRTPRVTRLGLDARAELCGPSLTLDALSRLAVGDRLPVENGARVEVSVAGRPVASGVLDSVDLDSGVLDGRPGTARSVVLRDTRTGEPTNG